MSKIKELKKIKNNIIAGTLSITTLLSMTGCGDDGKKQDEKSTTSITSEYEVDSKENTTLTALEEVTTAPITTEEITTTVETTAPITTEEITTTVETTAKEETTEEITTAKTTTKEETTTKKVTTKEEITTTAKTTQWYEEKQYDELSENNINDINYFLYYSEQFRLEFFGGDIRIATYRYRDFYPEQDECDFRKECKFFMALINLDKLEKSTLKQIFIDYSENDIKRCALAIRELFLYHAATTKYTYPNYDKYCVDEETRGQLNTLKNQLIKLGNKKDIDSYYTEVYDPFFNLTGEINASNAKPCMYYYYCLSEGNITMLTSKPLKYWEAEFIKLEDWIVSDLTKDTIFNYSKGKTIGQYIND